ncbi:hypothetical protein Tco_1416869, partial [Tanacetum coccineum]
MKRVFLSQKGSRGRRGVKEKDKVVAVKDVVSPSMIDEPVVMEKQSSLVDTCIPNVEKTGLSSYPPLPTQGSTVVGNTPGMSSYTNVTSEPSRKALNLRTLFTPRGNEIVVVPVEFIRAISERFANTAYGIFLGKWVAYPVVANYVRNTWGKYGLVKLMLNSSIRIFSLQFSSMEDVSKKPTASTSGNKKKGVEPTKEVSNSNPFDVLHSVDNDVKFGTNEGTSNLASNGANSSGSSFWNFETSSTSTTPIV